MSSFIENAFLHRSSSVPSNLPSPLRVASVGKQFGLSDSNHPLNGIKFANQCIPNFHPHSFPEYHDNLANGVPCSSASTIADMVINLQPKVAEATDSKQIRRGGSIVRPVELDAGGKLIMLFHCLFKIFAFAAYFWFWYLVNSPIRVVARSTQNMFLEGKSMDPAVSQA